MGDFRAAFFMVMENIVKSISPGKSCIYCDNCIATFPNGLACQHWNTYLPNPEKTVCYVMDDSLNPEWDTLIDEIYESQKQQA
jgi:hypothetical protein